MVSNRVYAPNPMNQLNMIEDDNAAISGDTLTQEASPDYQIFIIDAYIYHLADIPVSCGVTKCDLCGARSNKITTFGCIDCFYNICNFEADSLNMINNYIDRPVDIIIRLKNDVLQYSELDAVIFFNCGLTVEQFNNLHFIAKGVIINKYNNNTSGVDDLCAAMLGTGISSGNAPAISTPEYVSFVYITNIGCIISITVVFRENRANPYLMLEPRVYGCTRCSTPQSLMCYPCIHATSAGGQSEEIGAMAMSADITSLRLSPATINVLNACLLKYNCEFISNDILEIARYILVNSDMCLHSATMVHNLCSADILREVIAFDQSEIAAVNPDLERMYDTYEFVYSTLFK